MMLLFSSSIIAGVLEDVPDHAQFTRNPHFHILVVTVKEIHERITVNAKPPTGVLVVDEVIRGRLVKQGSYPFSVSPPMTVIDMQSETYEPKKEWLNQQYTGPSVGDKLIIFVYVTRSTLASHKKLVIQGDIYRYSDENRVKIIGQMVPPERALWIQFPLFFLIILFPVAGILLSVLARRKGALEGRAGTYRVFAFLLPVLSIILYFYYETGISIYSDIRVDLLLLWPATFVSGLLLIVLGLEIFIEKTRKRRI